MRHHERLGALCLACIGTVGCVQDRVYPGFYGEPRTREEPEVVSTPVGAAGTDHHAGVAGAASVPGTSNGGASGATALPVAGGAGSSATNEGESGAANAGAAGTGSGDPTPVACDLSGRWLATLHYVTDALGQLQTIHSFTYYEIERTAGGYVVSKGLHCGDEALAEGLFAVQVDFESTWASSVTRISYAGRAVSSAQTAAGCEVRFGKHYIVRGATYPHYTDPSIPMPTVEQPASGSTPGWEDWDGDGQPGVTGILSGTVAGKIFVAPRVWTELGGTVPDTDARLRLPVQWDQQPNMLGFDGSPLLASESVRAADPSLHFAELARLSDGQATGDDLSICRAVVELATILTPAASAL
jgi:hypothetical protein